MAQTSVKISIDENLKHDFEAVCSEIGLTMTAAFNVFAKTVTARKEIPFKLTTELSVPKDEEWGHLFPDKTLSTKEAAGVAGEWKGGLSISLKGKSAWAEAAVNKENNRKRNEKKYGIA